MKRQRKADPYRGGVWNAAGALDCVERWADGYFLLREFTVGREVVRARQVLGREGAGEEVPPAGRLDGLLVPVGFDAEILASRHWPKPWLPSWDRPGFVAVEVKVSRSDFQAGLRKGQFSRYADLPAVRGLYLAAPRDVCKTAEVPDGVGHLVVSRRGDLHRCVCRRHATFHPAEVPVDLLWQVLFRCRELMRERELTLEREVYDALEKFGEEAGATVMAACKKLMAKVRGTE